MKLLMPSNYTLLDSNVPASEAMAFTNRLYTAGELVAFDKYVYEKLESDEVFEVFNNRKYYTEGNNCSFGALNYVCILATKNQTPNTDSRFTAQPTTVWANSTNYTQGQLVSFGGKTYICLKSHLSSPVGSYKSWESGRGCEYYTTNGAYTVGGTCQYNGRYFKITAVFQAGSGISRIAPSESVYYVWNRAAYYVWDDITSIVYMPSVSGEFWQEISYFDFNDTLFYGIGDVVLYDGIFYKCATAITSTSPSSDTTHWKVVTSKTPSSSESWKKIATLNRFKMFDQFLNTVTAQNGDIEVLLNAPNTQALYLGNLYADSVSVDVLDNESNIIESFEADLFNAVSDYQDYFYGDWIVERKNNVIFERATLTTNVSYKICIRGDVCTCGILIIGKSHNLGFSQYEIQDESLDYSKVLTDTDTGETYLEQGNEVPILNIDIFLNTSAVDSVKKKLRDARGLPVLFFDKLETTRVYGFIRKRSTLISGPVKTVITLDIEGLI